MDLEQVETEIKISSMLTSEYCIRYYKTIETAENLYLILEYANSFDLETLVEQRGSLRQDEARIVMRQLVLGLKDLQSQQIVHRDLKLANVLLHFPYLEDFDKLTASQKCNFLKTVDLTA